MAKKKQSGIVEEVEDFISRYVVIPEGPYKRVLALFVIHTWQFATDDKIGARTSPILYINSPEKQSGKSRLLEVLEVLVANPMRSTNVTSAVLFHAIEKMQPTLLLDEVDAIWHGTKNEELRGILNGGYKEGGHVWRMDKGEPRAFNTFSPKVLAGINNGYLPDTIADRAIPVTLLRKKESDKVEQFFSLEVKDEIEPFLDEMAVWAYENEEKLRYHTPKKIEHASDRQWEIAMPLVSIGELLGVDDVHEVMGEILKEEIERDTESPREHLLRKIRDLFELKQTTKLFTQDIVDHMDRKDFTSAKSVATILNGDFGIESRSVRVGNRVKRGYLYSDFQDAFDRLI